MKHKIILFFIAIIPIPSVYAQESSVEKSLFGVQVGVLGIYAHHEAKLTEKWAFRSEIGLNGELFRGAYNETGILFAPSISIEPRWYYNLENRIEQDKSIINNNGNFFTFRLGYNPDWFVVSNEDYRRTYDQIIIIPKWGIRRNLGQHIHYELGVGLGYRYIFLKEHNFTRNKSEVILDLHLRFGFNF